MPAPESPESAQSEPSGSGEQPFVYEWPASCRPCVCFQDRDWVHGEVEQAQGRGEWLSFLEPVCVVATRDLSQVNGVLDEVERQVGLGLYAAGFVTYEASPAFDASFAVKGESDGAKAEKRDLPPLAWFGLFRRLVRSVVPPGAVIHEEVEAVDFELTEQRYTSKVREIHASIEAGTVYQVNLTFPAAVTCDSVASLFRRLETGQSSAGGSCLLEIPDPTSATGQERIQIASASPELFFALGGQEIVTRPMKGTAERGRTHGEDLESRLSLQASEKERAENLMIVDMMRNDLGRIAFPGSVKVEDLFKPETHRTLHQMTSTVKAKTDRGLGDLFGALFPCSSITGAPKVSAMKEIERLEDGPRGIYTGAIGFWLPGRIARFSVAIRTAFRQGTEGPFQYGTGSGVVWDSEAASEYSECRTKTLALTSESIRFGVLESLLWRPGLGYWMLEAHLARLVRSAEYFGFPVDRFEVAAALRGLSLRCDSKVRLVVTSDGVPVIDVVPIDLRPGGSRAVWNVAVSGHPVSSKDVFLFHKTTHREVYVQSMDRALAERTSPGERLDDVLLVNERGELTESTRANVSLLLDGEWFTPPVESGLLQGVFRDRLLARGLIRERVLTPKDLEAADRILLLNSVRGFIVVELAKG